MQGVEQRIRQINSIGGNKSNKLWGYKHFKEAHTHKNRPAQASRKWMQHRLLYFRWGGVNEDSGQTHDE